MARKKRPKPIDPAEIAHRRALARRDPAQWGPDFAALHHQPDVTVSLDQGKPKRIERCDVFRTLFVRAALSEPQFSAVRRLMEAMAVRARTAGSGAGGMEPVDCSSPIGGVSDAALHAGREVDRMLSAIGPLNAQLLTRLIEPGVIHGRQIDWRAIVHAVTGEADATAQTATVRSACANLAHAYQAHDQANRPRRDLIGLSYGQMNRCA